MTNTLLRLIAFDAEDLGVVSAHVQDAVLRVQDMAFDQKARIFALLANRFDWTCMVLDGKPCRRRTVLNVRNVVGVRSRGVELEQSGQVLNLLAVTFEETNAPAGDVALHFSGGNGVCLSVECLEATLSDLGEAWQTGDCPKHDLREEN
jgi:hypothetical protein